MNSIQFQKFEEANDLSINIYSVSGCYGNKHIYRNTDTDKNETEAESASGCYVNKREQDIFQQNVENVNEQKKEKKKKKKKFKACLLINDMCDVDDETESSDNENSNDEYEIDFNAEIVDQEDISFYRLADIKDHVSAEEESEEKPKGDDEREVENTENQIDQNVTEFTMRKNKYFVNSGNLDKKSKTFSNQIQPIRVTKNQRKYHIDLLVIENQFRKEDSQHHFIAVRDFNRFVSGNNTTKGRHHYCKRCLQPVRVSSKDENNPDECDRFQEHLRLCNGHNIQRLHMPYKGQDTLFFKSIQKQQEFPFVMYADFEAKQVENLRIVKIDKRSGMLKVDK